MTDPFFYFKTKKLSNGLTIHAAQWPRCSGEKFFIIINVGAMQDPVGKEGTAHLLEHLLSYDGSSEGWRSSKVFNDVGGSINLSVSPFATEIEFNAPADVKFLAKALERVSMHILNPPFTESDFEKEKEIVVREFRQSYATIFSFDSDLAIKRILYSGTGMDRFILPIFGSMETISNISYQDVRSFHEKYYKRCPACVSIVAVGALSTEDVFGLAQSCPLALEEKGRISALWPTAAWPKFSCKRIEFDLSKHIKTGNGELDFSVIEFLATLPAIDADQKNNIFRSMFVEVLNEEIRHKRHWSYGSTFCLRRMGPIDLLRITFKDIDRENIKSVEAVFESTLSAIAKDRKLLERIKKIKLGRLLLCGYSYDSLADAAAFSISSDGRLETMTMFKQRLEAVTISDIGNICDHILSGHGLISIVS